MFCRVYVLMELQSLWLFVSPRIPYDKIPTIPLTHHFNFSYEENILSSTNQHSIVGASESAVQDTQYENDDREDLIQSSYESKEMHSHELLTTTFLTTGLDNHHDAFSVPFLTYITPSLDAIRTMLTHPSSATDLKMTDTTQIQPSVATVSYKLAHPSTTNTLPSARDPQLLIAQRRPPLGIQRSTPSSAEPQQTRKDSISSASNNSILTPTSTSHKSTVKKPKPKKDSTTSLTGTDTPTLTPQNNHSMCTNNNNSNSSDNKDCSSVGTSSPRQRPVSLFSPGKSKKMKAMQMRLVC